MNIHRCVLLAVCCLSFIACYSPDEPLPTQPVKTEFAWTLDTVAHPNSSQLSFNDIYGTSNGHVYATGYTGVAGEDLWEYSDGSWKLVRLVMNAGGPLPGQIVDLHGLDGAGNGNVWIAGSRVRSDSGKGVIYGFLACYDGTKFKEIDLFNEPEIVALKVISDNDVYFGGFGPTLYHHDGSNVGKFDLPMDRLASLSAHPIERMQISQIAGVKGRILVSGFLDYDQFGYAYWQLALVDNKDWEIEVFNNSADRSSVGGLGRLWTSPEGHTYSVGPDAVFQYEPPVWRKIATPAGSLLAVFGTSDRNLWAAGHLNAVTHSVDGVFKKISVPLPVPGWPIDWVNGWTNGNEVFLVATSSGIIAHGK